MLKGLPASGKSTVAKELIQGGGNYFRVNRDLLREMFFFSDWSGKREDLTVEMERILVRTLLVDYNVIVDDTNLNPSNEAMWRGLAEEEGANFEVKFVDTPLDECIERDSRRDKKVGRSVIMAMAMQYGLYKPEKIVICDIDGTVADLEHRRHYVHKDCERCKGNALDGKACGLTRDIESTRDLRHEMGKDWKSFFAEMGDDTLITDTAQLLWKKINEGCKVFYVSARPEQYRKETEQWLKKVGAPNYEALFMRRAHDKRDDDLIKEEILNKFFLGKTIIDTVFDDRPRVIRMWRKNGLNVHDCGNGREF